MARPTAWYQFKQICQSNASPRVRFQASQTGGALLDQWHDEVTHAWHRVPVADWKANYHAMQQWLEQHAGFDHFNCIFQDPLLVFDIEDAETALLFKLMWC